MGVILWRRFEELAKVLSSRVITRRDEVGVLSAYLGGVFCALEGDLSHNEVLRVRKTFCFWSYKDEIAKLRGIAKREAHGYVAAVRTSHKRNLRDLPIMQNRRDIICLEVGFRCC